jgi:zinc protease
MIQYERFELENGLRVILHEDQTTPMAAVSVVYDVGSRDEHFNKTGFAHLFEHLMFSGSLNVQDFDTPIQLAGGENNGFTNNDMINFYEFAPAENIETLLWLESDRMLSLDINQKKLNIQKKVVVEEFKETVLNEPYGDIWHHILPMAYTSHSYKWPTIGVDFKHIEEAKIDDVKTFYKNYFHPQNAILCIAGKINIEKSKELVHKWFGNIPSGNKIMRDIPQEPEQEELRSKTVQGQIPVNSIYFAYKMPARRSHDYLICDLISDLLSDGPSSVLYKKLVKEDKIFTEVDAYLLGSMDEGLFIIEGKLTDNHTLEKGESSILEIIEEFKNSLISSTDVEKILNRIEYSQLTSEYGIMNKALNLCYYELLGDVELINTEVEKYKQISPADIQRVANQIFQNSKVNILKYVSNEN